MDAPWMDDPEEMHSRAPKATTARMSVSTRGASASRRWLQIAAPPPPTMIRPNEPLDEQPPEDPPPAPRLPEAPPPPEFDCIRLTLEEKEIQPRPLEAANDLACQRNFEFFL